MELTLNGAQFKDFLDNQTDKVLPKFRKYSAKLKREMFETFKLPFSKLIKPNKQPKLVNLVNNVAPKQEPKEVNAVAKPDTGFVIDKNISDMNSRKVIPLANRVLSATAAFFPNLYKGGKGKQNKVEPAIAETPIVSATPTIQEIPNNVVKLDDYRPKTFDNSMVESAVKQQPDLVAVDNAFSEKLPVEQFAPVEVAPYAEIQPSNEAYSAEEEQTTPAALDPIVKPVDKPQIFSSVSTEFPSAEEMSLTADSVLSHVSSMATELNQLREQVQRYAQENRDLRTTLDSQNAKLNAMSFDLRKAEIKNNELISANKRQELKLADSEAQLNSVRVDAQNQINEANAIAEKKIADAEIRGAERYNKLVRGLAGVISPKTAPAESTESSMRMAA